MSEKGTATVATENTCFWYVQRQPHPFMHTRTRKWMVVFQSRLCFEYVYQNVWSWLWRSIRRGSGPVNSDHEKLWGKSGKDQDENHLSEIEERGNHTSIFTIKRKTIYAWQPLQYTVTDPLLVCMSNNHHYVYYFLIVKSVSVITFASEFSHVAKDLTSLIRLIRPGEGKFSYDSAFIPIAVWSLMKSVLEYV